MQIYNDLSGISDNKNSVITLGTFDGIHLGHQKIIKKVADISSRLNARNFLITFDPHPRKIVSPNYDLHLLSTLDEKTELFRSYGIDNVLILKFTKEFSQLSPKEFILKYLVEGIGVSEVVIGYDHHFGKGRGGNSCVLNDMGKDHGFNVTIVSGYSVGDIIVSSTKIRNALMDGGVSKANKMLGRVYSFEGSVIRGDNRGKKLGFPTANLEIESGDKLLPAIGIYAVECTIENKKHFGLLSIGKRPTFHDSGEVVPEVYLFDFNDDIYGAKLRVAVVERIRGEEKFSSAEDLIAQMEKDSEVGLQLLSKLTNN